MQGDPCEAVAPHLAFAGMNASANREAQRAGAYDELLLSIAPHGLARRTTPEHRRRSDVPRAVAMKLTGHETDAVYSRYHIARERTYAQALRVSPTTSRPYTTQYKSQARDRDGDQGSESEFAQVIEKWRRAGDSNPDTGYPVVDFKSTALPVEASPPSPQSRILASRIVASIQPLCPGLCPRPDVGTS
jgi:hypothetical protein